MKILEIELVWMSTSISAPFTLDIDDLGWIDHEQGLESKVFILVK